LFYLGVFKKVEYKKPEKIIGAGPGQSLSLMPPLFYLPRSDAFQVKKDLVVSRLAYWFFLSRDLIQRGLSSTAQTVDLPV
jgi:hypothetical protein